jgi:hypothetical protein
VKPGDELLKCCRSLLASVEAAEKFRSELHSQAYAWLMDSQLALCRALALISSGIGIGEGVEDTLENREREGIRHFKSAASCIGLTCKESAFLDGKSDVGFVCRLLPGGVVPLFASFRMCTNVLESFQWGRRKQKSKEIAAEFAKLAMEFAVFVKGMKATLSRCAGFCFLHLNWLILWIAFAQCSCISPMPS